ncbi:spin [Symbiodinium sp. CCMP2592]|nr:spin [Symbiodinium sp. CCMP2592]
MSDSMVEMSSRDAGTAETSGPPLQSSRGSRPMEELAALFTAVVASQLALESWSFFLAQGGSYHLRGASWQKEWRLMVLIFHIISAPAAGFLGHHVPRNMLILGASIAISVGLSTCALSYFLSGMAFFLLFLASLSFGVGSGLMQPLLWSLVMEKSEAKRRGAAFGFLHGMSLFSKVLQSENPFLRVQELMWLWPLAASGFNILTGAMCAWRVTDSSRKSGQNLPMILGRRTFWVLAVPAGLLKASSVALASQILFWFEPGYRRVVWTYLGLGKVISAVVGGVALDGIDSNSPVTGPPSVLTATAILPIIVISVGFFVLDILRRSFLGWLLMRPGALAFGAFGTWTWLPVVAGKMLSDIVRPEAYVFLYGVYLAVLDIIYLVVHNGMGWWDETPDTNVTASHILLGLLLTVLTVPVFFAYPEDRQVVARAVQMAEAVLKMRGPMSALEYEAVPGDDIDQQVQHFARQIPEHLGEWLTIYRKARGEYEVSEEVVRMAWQSTVSKPTPQHPEGQILREVFVYVESEAEGATPGEPLHLFLRHSANVAYDLHFGSAMMKVPEGSRLSFAEETGTLLKDSDADSKYKAMLLASEQAQKREEAALQFRRMMDDEADERPYTERPPPIEAAHLTWNAHMDRPLLRMLLLFISRLLPAL